MHVVVVPADRGGCGYSRLIWPGQAVSLARPDWTVEIRPPETVMAGFHGDRLVGVQGLDPLPDVLVMQRVGTPGQLAVLRWASERGVATVLDFDDAMWCIDPANTAYKTWQGGMHTKTGQHWRLCDTAAEIADLVTVTTEHLGRRYARRHGHVEVLPNCVPRAATEVPGHDRPDEGFVAGWSGFTATHPRDCEVSAPAARAVLDVGGALRVIADGEGAARDWGVDPALVDCVPPQKMGPDYYRSMSSLDLMLVGLRDTPFNRSKSSLKVLEAAAAGVPSIAPDNPPHRALARTGFPVTLASSPSEWADAAKRFVCDPAYWEEQCLLVDRAVKERHTIEGNAERWASAWERALRIKR